jgi:nanoRNase/pAp phosphatase (c-di-AMP/oligoRNAs hydrolase)
MNEPIEESKPCKPRNGNGCAKHFAQFRECVEAKLGSEANGHVALFTHPFPDPDAMASMMGMKWLLEKVYGAEVDMFAHGEISHPQNINMHNLLGPKLIPAEQACPAEYDIRILVDVVPSNAGTGGKPVEFDVVIDHHVEQTNGEYHGLFINLHTGSCASTIHHLIKFYDEVFEEDNDSDSAVATALAIGIATDTCFCQNEGTTEYDHDSSKELFPYRDPEAMQKILKFKKNKVWVQKMAEAAMRAVIKDSVAIVGLGLLTSKQRDLIAVMADEMLTWDGVDTAIVFSIVDGDRIEGSVRTMNPSVSAAKLCHDLGHDRGGAGWGHSKKAAYKYNLGGMSIDQNDDDNIQQKTWALADEREIIRIERVFKK